ncbi:MAG: hypothetical protein EGQ80_06285 [Streptococcus lutetiensis]|nr:hypothetical protein [Streptococcus lutetiensis]
MTLTNLKEKAIERTGISFWHGLSAVKHPLGVYDCGSRDHAFGNEFNVTSGKTYTVRVIAKQTRGSVRLAGGIWYTAMTSGHPFDAYGAFTLVGELSEDGLGVYERKVVVASGKTKGKIFIQLEQTAGGGYSTAWRIYDGQVFDENGQPLVTDQNIFGTLTSPMAAPDGTYIWKRTITYYTDGTNDTVWEYSGVGEKGNTGANGQTSHVHFAFADNATGGGFSLTTPKAYMGWYADFNEAASNDPTKYRWSKWKGDQGLPGKPGTDGKTSYFHMAYADSADGRTGFSFKESGQQYQGYYTDFTQTSSTDPNNYTWMDRLANVQIDQLNLIGAFNLTPQNATFDKTDYTLTSTTTTNTKDGSLQLQFFDAKNVVFTGFVLAEKVGKFAKSFKITKSYERFRIKINGNASDAFVWCYDKDLLKLDTDYVLSGEVLSLSSDGRGNGGQIKHLKIQKGKLATGFSKAPQDVDSDINSKADQTLTQEQLNALEAKRLQMEAELKAKATLEQVSELETFVNNLKKEDLDGRQKIIEITKAIEERVKDIEPIMEYSQKLKFMDTYITQGNGGMIIGKNDGSTKVVVTPDRISFQSGGSEVAYISQSMLHIDNGVFTLSLQLGHYITRVHPKNEYVNGTYFVK